MENTANGTTEKPELNASTEETIVKKPKKLKAQTVIDEDANEEDTGDAHVIASADSKVRDKKGAGAQPQIIRLYLYPRQHKLLMKLKREWGMSISEHIRRAIDPYLDTLIENGDLIDEDREARKRSTK